MRIWYYFLTAVWVLGPHVLELQKPPKKKKKKGCWLSFWEDDLFFLMFSGKHSTTRNKNDFFWFACSFLPREMLLIDCDILVLFWHCTAPDGTWTAVVAFWSCVICQCSGSVVGYHASYHTGGPEFDFRLEYPFGTFWYNTQSCWKPLCNTKS